MSQEVGKKYCFEVPVSLLGQKSGGTLRVAIVDENGNGVIDHKDVVKVKGPGGTKELGYEEQKYLFKKLGVSRHDRMDLGFAVKYFNQVGQVAKQVSRGNFETTAEISDALLPETESIEAARKWYLRAKVNGFDNPMAFSKTVLSQARQVMARRDKLRQDYKELRSLYATNDPSYWKFSKKLRNGMLRLGMKREVELVFATDRKAYARAELKKHIPEDTEKYLAAIGKIQMDPNGFTVAEKNFLSGNSTENR